MFAWGIFFTRLSNDDLNVDNWQYCLDKFEYFKQKLNVWIPPEKSFTIDGAIKHITMKLKHEENLKLVIVCGIEISKLALLVVIPKYSPAIHLASGILYDGGLELVVYGRPCLAQPTTTPRAPAPGPHSKSQTFKKFYRSCIQKVLFTKSSI